MATDRPRPPQTPVDPPPPPRPARPLLTWVIVGGIVLLVVFGYVLVTSGS